MAIATIVAMSNQGDSAQAAIGERDLTPDGRPTMDGSGSTLEKPNQLRLYRLQIGSLTLPHS